MVNKIKPSTDRLCSIRGMLHGDLETFKKARSTYTKDMIEKTFLSALHYGRLDCIMYMVQNGLVSLQGKPYCDIVTKRGHYDCLKYLYDNGCNFNRYTALIAMIREDHKCLRYIMENGGTLNMPSDM